MRKRGLSAVITTLIIILLALVAVGIVWVVVNNLLKGGAEGISLGFLTSDAEIKSVLVDEDAETVSINVERKSGDEDLIKIIFIFENSTDSYRIERETTLEQFGQKTFIFYLYELEVDNINKISIAFIYATVSGGETEASLVDDFKLRGDNIITGGAIAPEPSNFEKYGPVGWETADYTVSTGGEPIIEITRVIIDPLDVHVGQIQTFTAYVTSPYEIIEVTTITQLDNEILNLDLEATGNPDEYSASWEVYDTHIEVYRTLFIARDSEGNEAKVNMSWTDPCTTNNMHGSDYDMDWGCTVTTVDGLDEGNMTITSGGGLTLSGGTWVFNPGYNITMAGGTITMSSGAIQKGYLYYVDTDEDGWGTFQVYAWRSSSGGYWAGHTRAHDIVDDIECNDNNQYVWKNFGGMVSDNDWDGYTDTSPATECVGAGPTPHNGRSYWNDVTDGDAWMDSSQKLGENDCNDANAAVWVTTNCYTDSDGDTYGTGSSSPVCGTGSCGAGYATQGGDCCDTDANAKPGQTAWFTTARSGGCGGSYPFDYNCDSVETKHWATTGGGCEPHTCVEAERLCIFEGTSTVGWSGTAPDCGVFSASYYTGSYDGCDDKGCPSCPCDEWVVVCTTTSHTQECH